MRKYLFLLSFLFISIFSFGQADFIWGLNFYPNYSDGRLVVLTQNISQDSVISLDQSQRGKMSYTAGLFAGWKGPKAAFQLGINFMESGFQTEKVFVTENEPAPVGAQMKQSIYQSYYLEVPINLLFFHELENGSEFSFSMGSLLSYNFQNFDNTTYFLEGRSEKQKNKLGTDGFRNVNYGFQAGIGWGKKLTEHMVFYLHPNFKFWFRGMKPDDSDINHNLYSLGIRTGLRFHIKRDWEE